MTYTLIASEKEILNIYAYYAFFRVPSKNEYVKYLFKLPGVTITVYTSNKVVFQGKNNIIEYEKWLKNEKAAKPLAKNNYPKNITSIGSDEVGTGDYFGPIIVVAAFIDEQIKEKIATFTITDSKKLTDKYILSIGNEVQRLVPHELLICDNSKFNDLHEKGYNMNKIKALMHNRVLYKLSQAKDTEEIVIDQFTTINSYFKYLVNQEKVVKNITFETKAESKYLSVAAASVIARYYFLKAFDKLVKDSGYNLLKGASNKVDEVAAKIIAEKGLEYLANISKISFKNTNKAIAINNKNRNVIHPLSSRQRK